MQMILWLLDEICTDEFCILHPWAKLRSLYMHVVHNSISVSRDAMWRPEISQTAFILHVSTVKKRLRRLRSGDRNTEGVVGFYITQGNVASMWWILSNVAGAAVNARDVTIGIKAVVGPKM